MVKKTNSDYAFILNKAQAYCGYQERCIFDISNKLKEWKVQQEVADKIISQLINDDFINEERYAGIFAGSKFRINKWGRNKIIYKLKRKKIPDLIIQIGLGEIEDEEYINTLKEILSKKSFLLKEPDPRKHKQKLANYAISKGFRPQLVWDAIEGNL
jgi:regulatory protein